MRTNKKVTGDKAHKMKAVEIRHMKLTVKSMREREEE